MPMEYSTKEINDAIDLKNELLQVELKMRKKVYRCLFDGCKENAIRSHSQQKNSSLKAISNNALQVYALDSNHARAFDIKTQKLKVRFILKKIASASTFPGFCEKHEALFSIFEKKGIEIHNDKHACHLAYRTVSYELSRQREMLDKSELRGIFTEREIYLSYSINKELTPLMNDLLSIINNNDFDNLKTLWKVIPKNLGVSCSSCISLYNDLPDKFYMRRGKGDDNYPTFTFDVLPSENETIIICTWLKKFDHYSDWLIKSFSNEKEFERIFNRFVFFDSEDICISPDLWDKEPRIKETVIKVEHAIDKRLIKSLEPQILIHTYDK